MIYNKELKRVLRSELTIPAVVDNGFQNALNSIDAAQNRGSGEVRRRKKAARILRRTLLAAAILAVLSAGVTLAAYVSGENSAFFELEKLRLPKTGSIPANELERGGKKAIIYSAVGLRIYYDAFELPDSDPYYVKYAALEYDDGTRYVVLDDNNNTNNSDYALGTIPEVAADGRTYLTFCFNRVVDTEQVAKIIVNDIELEAR